MVLMTPSKEDRMTLWPEAFTTVTESSLEDVTGEAVPAA